MISLILKNYNSGKFQLSKKFCIQILLIVLLFSTITPQCILNSTASAVPSSSSPSNNETRTGADIFIDSAVLTGAYNGEKALFTLDYSFHIIENGTLEIPLIGLSNDAMAINLTVDGTKGRIQFNKEYYYFLGELSGGDHNLIFKFSTNILANSVKNINYNLFGPALYYSVDFTIPTFKDHELKIIECGDAIVFEEEGSISLKWEFYAIENTKWGLTWAEYIVPAPSEIKCWVGSEVLIEDSRAIIAVNYEMEFQGFAIEEITFDLNPQMALSSTDNGSIKSTTGKSIVKFNELIRDQISINITFELKFISELELIIPKPLNCNFTGELVIFSEPDVIVQLIDNIDSILTGYADDIKPDTNFIGKYIFLDTSKLYFRISTSDSKITAEIIDILIPTFEGYDIESWIYFNFYGNSPNSLTIDFPITAMNNNIQKPQILFGSNMPLPIRDHNWDSDLNRLILWLENDISNEYALGLRRSHSSNNVVMEQLTINEVEVFNYYIAHYFFNGITYTTQNQNGLQMVSYNIVPQKLQAHLQFGLNTKIYKSTGEYKVELSLEKTAGLKSEVFCRNWIRENGIDIHQVIRITSLNSIVNTFTFSVPANIISIDVHDCASWTLLEETLVVYIKRSESKIISFNIEAEISGNSGAVSPIRPVEISDYQIYTMFGSDSKLNITIEPHQAEPMNPDELPEYFKREINTPKAVNLFYSTEDPNFIVNTNEYKIEEPPTTIIELAQLTIITSIDRKIAVQALYMIKNVDDLEFHVNLPKDSVVWMVLVGGKSIPIIQHNNILIITLIRSTLTGENIAFPVEIVYMIIEPKSELELILPIVDIPILNLKINVGLSSSIYIVDPEINNPSFEFNSHDVWRDDIVYHSSDNNKDSDYSLSLRSRLSSSYVENVDEPAYIYIGLNESNSVSNTIEIERIDAPEGEQKNFNLDISDFELNSDTNIKYGAITLTQGQYILSNSGASRQITVIGGMTHQVIFDFEDEMVFTGVPPIYLQFPESGQVLRFSKIFIKQNEDLQLKLVEGESEGISDKAGWWEIFESNEYSLLMVSVLVILAVIILIKAQKSKRQRVKPRKLHIRTNEKPKQPKRRQKRVKGIK